MCGVGEALLAFRVLSTVKQFQQQNAMASAIERQQERAREAYLIGYNRDLERIQTESNQVAIQERIEEMKIDAARRRDIAKALNQNVGNARAVVQDLGLEFEFAEQDLRASVEQDYNTLNRQQLEAFNQLESNFAGLTPPTRASKTGLALGIGEAVGGYLSIPGENRKFFSGFNPTGTPTGK